MKTYILKSLLFLAVPALILGACKKNKITDGVVEVFNSSFSNYTASFKFVDANTGVQLYNEDIEVRIGGEGASSVVDNLNGTNIGVDYGIMAVAISDMTTPTQQSPVNFTVHAKANGYLPTSTDVTIFQEGHTSITVKMANINDAVDGLSSVQNQISGVSSSSGVSSEFNLSPATSTSGTTANLTVPMGTKLLNENNSPLSGAVDVEFTYFDPNGSNSSLILPGNMMNANIENGAQAQMRSLGAISLDMYANGNEVKNFDSPIEMTISIPDGIVNLSGNTLNQGDSYGVYSYDEENSIWVLESTETLTLNTTTGLLEVNFEMNHLSFWQIADLSLSSGYSYNEVNFSATCPDYFNGATNITLNFSVKLDGSFVTVYSNTLDITMNKPSFLMAAEINSDNGYYVIKRKEFPNDYLEYPAELGTNPTIEFPSSWCPVETIETFNIELETYCPGNPNRKVRPQCLVLACKEGEMFTGGEWITVGQMTDGTITTNTGVLEKGQKYTLFTIFNNKVVSLTGTLEPFDVGSRLIDGNDIDLSRALTNAECAYLDVL